MSKVLYLCGGLIIGAFTGSITTFFVMKTKYDKVFKEESDEINKNIKENPTPSRNIDPEIKEKLLKNWDKPPIVSVEEVLAEGEHPVDSDEDEALSLAEDLENEKKEVENDPPRIISEEEIGELSPGWEECEWYYYPMDNIMTDDNENIIDDYELFIDDLLVSSGFSEDDEEDEIIILASKYSKVYRIHKILVPYSYH